MTVVTDILGDGPPIPANFIRSGAAEGPALTTAFAFGLIPLGF